MDAIPAEDRLLTVGEVCRRLALSRPMVYKQIAHRRLPSVKIGKSRRVIESDLRTFIQRLREQA